jgi:hypothetical protein
MYTSYKKKFSFDQETWKLFFKLIFVDNNNGQLKELEKKYE